MGEAQQGGGTEAVLPQVSTVLPSNLYVHFPFCRRKCRYCALYSRTGTSAAERDEYCRRIANEIEGLGDGQFSTIYFGGGSPAYCNLTPVLAALQSRVSSNCEFTVEFNPHEVTRDKLEALRDNGVNRISMGVEALEDSVLAAMGREYDVAMARARFDLVREYFDNAGIDLIVGYPGERLDDFSRYSALNEWGLKHCSVYSLQNERGLENIPEDDLVLDGIRDIASRLKVFGLERYEISNYAMLGYECRHNFAVWRGEDYLGIGEGAHGRIGLKRTTGKRVGYAEEEVSPDFDLKERTLFRLRTRDGINTLNFPNWRKTLDRFVDEQFLNGGKSSQFIYRLTPRGCEICDYILSELVSL